MKYYGPVPNTNQEDGASIWIVLQRILIPVIIFFRFHTLVVLVECWKNCYRVEERGGPGDEGGVEGDGTQEAIQGTRVEPQDEEEAKVIPAGQRKTSVNSRAL